MAMRKTSFFIAMIIVTVSGNAIAEERVVFDVDESVGWIVSTDATLAIALLVAGSARKRARKFRRRELRADPANSNANSSVASVLTIQPTGSFTSRTTLAREHEDKLVLVRVPVTHRGRGAGAERRVVDAEFREPCGVAERTSCARQDPRTERFGVAAAGIRVHIERVERRGN